jgi:hypothetical protein
MTSRFAQARRDLGKDRRKCLGERPRWVPFINADTIESKIRFTQSQVQVEGKRRFDRLLGITA